MAGDGSPFGMPEEPTLAGVFAEFVAGGFDAFAYDARWRLVSMSDDLQTMSGDAAFPDEVVVRAGRHWGTTLYIGSIITTGRTEVTALGDEVNEAARIEACATGGRLLASKDLIERLDPDDATTLEIDADNLTYTPLAELDTATDKARRDAPTIPVHDIAIHTT